MKNDAKINKLLNLKTYSWTLSYEYTVFVKNRITLNNLEEKIFWSHFGKSSDGLRQSFKSNFQNGFGLYFLIKFVEKNFIKFVKYAFVCL